MNSVFFCFCYSVSKPSITSLYSSSHQRGSQTFEGSAFIVLPPFNSLGLGLIDQVFSNLLVLQVVVKL